LLLRANLLIELARGGRASPIQTQWLKRGDVTIPRKLARLRFTTKYYEQFSGLGQVLLKA
jgi:hypothetical protein